MQRTRYSARGDVDGVTSCSRSNFQRACAGDAYPPPAPSRAPAQRQFANAVGLGFLTMSIAHEVNQPLSGIITNASTYIRMLDADPANLRGVRETVQRTIRDAYRCAEVIARLRALVVREEGACGSLDLNATARDAIADCADEPRAHRAIVLSIVDMPPMRRYRRYHRPIDSPPGFWSDCIRVLWNALFDLSPVGVFPNEWNC